MCVIPFGLFLLHSAGGTDPVMGDARDMKAFEAKVASLIAATRHLNVPQALALRSMTFKDPETRRWASDRQLTVVFNVILTHALERFDAAYLTEIRDHGFEQLLPPPGPIRDESLPVLKALTEQVLASLKQRDAPQDSIDTTDGPASAATGAGDLTEALATRANFETLLARGMSAAPPKSNRSPSPTREPAPLFPAQTGHEAETASTDDGLGVPMGTGEFTDFPTLFQDTLIGHVRKILTLLRIPGDSQGLRPPFMVAPPFAATYEDVVRRHILPKMLRSRHIQALATTHNWEEIGGGKLIEIMLSGEVNNPILHNWDSGWNAIRDSAKATGHGHHGKSGIKGKAPPPPPDSPWRLFREDATSCNYRPPEPDDMPLLRDIVRYEPEAIAKCWRELSQLYEQEFSPSGRQEQARDGALRDGIGKWADRLPEHMGEFLAIKAFFTFPRCNGFFMRRLITIFGRTDTERLRQAPFLSEFVAALGED